jgi:hypothetical protein
MVSGMLMAYRTEIARVRLSKPDMAGAIPV